jgi:hypothetical protein
MALEAWLSFANDSNKIKVLSCDFSFSQEIDETGKPSSRPQGGLINITVESTDKETLAQWMFSKMGMKDGKIEFQLRNNKNKTLSFKEGVCVSYSESFNASGGIPMIIHFTISPNSIKLGSAEFTNDWRKS